VKFRFVHEHRETFRVGVMCKVLKVSRRGYYAWQSRPQSDRERASGTLRRAIERIHAESRGTYGSPRVHAALRRARIACGRHRVARLTRDEGIRGKAKRRFRSIATKRTEMASAPNLLARRFSAPAPDRAWVADITIVRTGEGWLHLAIVLDLFSRKIVGWAMSERVYQALALEALAMAIARRRPEPGLIHHSDRGGPYAAAAYQDLLDCHGLVASMSRPANCLDNAVAESFFHTLKTELVYHDHYRTREAARLAIFEWIEGFYNRTRLHSTLGYRSPEEYETIASVA
jgi:transposase InsO family protein